jgi:hypothetical protein
MARTTHVKKAQQRYKQVPVLDEYGRQMTTPVMRADGTPKVTKHGRPVVMRQTVADKSQPLPMPKCEVCGTTIEVGQPYKHVTPSTGFGGTTRFRCDSCPSWQPWDLSNAWWARIAQVTSGFDVSEADSAESVREALEAVAEEIRGLAGESREAASNMEEGFGHATQQSQKAEERADALEQWADEIANADVPDYPEAEAEERWYIVDDSGSVSLGDEDYGYDSEEDAQAVIDAQREEAPDFTDYDELSIEARPYTPDDATEEQIDNWRTEVEDAVSVVDESPV